MGRPSKEQSEKLDKGLAWFDIKNYINHYKKSNFTPTEVLNEIIGRAIYLHLEGESLCWLGSKESEEYTLAEYCKKHPYEATYGEFLERSLYRSKRDIPARLISTWGGYLFEQPTFKKIMTGEVGASRLDCVAFLEILKSTGLYNGPPLWGARLIGETSTGKSLTPDISCDRVCGVSTPDFKFYGRRYASEDNCGSGRHYRQLDNTALIEVNLNASPTARSAEIDAIIKTLTDAKSKESPGPQYLKDARSYKSDHTLAVMDLLTWERFSRSEIPPSKIGKLLSTPLRSFEENGAPARVVSTALRAMDLGHLGLVSQALSQDENKNNRD